LEAQIEEARQIAAELGFPQGIKRLAAELDRYPDLEDERCVRLIPRATVSRVLALEALQSVLLDFAGDYGERLRADAAAFDLALETLRAEAVRVRSTGVKSRKAA
jgi:hypothetical protein